jgi:type VI secretion system protein ImpH
LASLRGRAAPPLARLLVEAPFRFDLDQAVRHLERLRPGSTPIGAGSEPEREAVRLRAAMRFDFPPSEVDSVALPAAGDGRAEVVVNAMALAGAFGPLPAIDGERVLAQLRRGDRAMLDFLDLFHHRLLALLLAARRAARPWLAAEPPAETGIARKLTAVLGLATPGLQGRLGLPERALLRYAGLLAHRRPSLHAVELVVADQFGLPVRVRGLCGTWRPLAESQLTAIGHRGRNRALGDGAVLGGRVWDQSGGIELRLGPLDRPAFEALLPCGKWHGRLKGLVAFASGRRVDATARLVLHGHAIPLCPLGLRGGLRLGWTSWLHGRPPSRDDDQVVLHLQSAV